MLIEKLSERFGARILESSSAHGEEGVRIARDDAPEIFRTLRDDPGFSFDLLVDLTAVDWPERKPRFDVVYHLGSVHHSNRLRIKIGVDAADPTVPTAAGIWTAADWLERECYDMFGIQFSGHPDLRRILLYDSFEGHPLRKDYPVQKRQPVVAETDPVVHPLRPSR
jgi:NADH-quinone oxidoreductase subunit C